MEPGGSMPHSQGLSIKSRRLRWAGQVARMEEGRSAFKILTNNIAVILILKLILI